MATLIEELGETVVSAMMGENQPVCAEMVVRNRAHAAGPVGLIGRYIYDFKDTCIYITKWVAKDSIWEGEAWIPNKKEKNGGSFKKYEVSREAIKAVL